MCSRRSAQIIELIQQFIPHDVHDADLSQVSPLFETTIDGKKHEVISISGKDGLLRLQQPQADLRSADNHSGECRHHAQRRGRSPLPRLAWRHGVAQARL